MHTPLFWIFRSVAGLISPRQGALLSSRPVLVKDTDEHFQVGLLLLQLFLFQLHAMKRLWESLAVANFSSQSKQHVSVTALGQQLQTQQSKQQHRSAVAAGR